MRCTLLVLLVAVPACEPAPTEPVEADELATPHEWTASTATRVPAAVKSPATALPVVTDGETRRPVWVVFADRGPLADMASALLRREAQLAPRALARRRRVRGDRGVDARDLPPHADYIAAVMATGAVPRRSSRWLNAVAVDATPTELAAVEALPFVRGLHPVLRAPVQIPVPSPSTLHAEEADYGGAWGQLNLIGVPALHDCGLTGEGVVVGVQDTGFRLTHPAFATTRVLETYDFLNNDENVANEEGDPGSQDNHGTMVLSLITGYEEGVYRGVAPNVEVLLTKTEDVSVEQPFEEDRYVEGLEWIEERGADIFTASLGYIDWYERDDLDGATAVTTVAVEIAVENGLIVLAPMGNAGPAATTLIAPSDAPNAIAVGAVNLSGTIANFSSRGPTADGRIKPDVSAPGAGVTVARPGNNTTYLRGNGTSFATPITAGVAALLLEAYPNLTPRQMADLLRSTASQPDAPDNNYGHGLINALAAGELFCTCTDADEDFYFDVACGGRDCADGDPTAYPGGTEVCDGADNDCNSTVDDGLEAPEADRTQGVCVGQLRLCAGSDGWVEPNYHAVEGYEMAEASCDGRDNDCDGETDEGLVAPMANRQSGVCEGSMRVCSGNQGWTEPDYAEIAGYEDAELTCDGRDNDCDGETDEALTPPLALRQDGVCEGAQQVCAGEGGWIEPDYAVLANHESEEISCDGLDNDCDAETDETLEPPLADNQLGVCATSVRVCSGADGWIEPDYALRDRHEVDEVTCDGLDNDCDGDIDEGLEPPLADNQDGVCAASVRVCAGLSGWIEPDYDAVDGFGVETCDGLDNDCDGTVDNDLDAPDAARTEGVCAGSRQRCDGAAGWVEPEYADIDAYDVEETCDGLDNDCDGRTDEELSPGLALRNLGVCLGATQVCLGAASWAEPNYAVIEGFEEDEVRCDGLDNDCDGQIDEDPACATPDAGCHGEGCADTCLDCDAAAVPAAVRDDACACELSRPGWLSLANLLLRR